MNLWGYFAVYIVIFLNAIFKGVIASHHAISEIKRIMKPTPKDEKRIALKLFQNIKLKERLIEYYNCREKARIYICFGIISLVQLIISLIKNDINLMNINVCTFTMILAFMESRDNYTTSNKMIRETKPEVLRILKVLYECESITSQDSLLDMLEKKGVITTEDRIKLMKADNFSTDKS